jgi:hypothetical protein
MAWMTVAEAKVNLGVKSTNTVKKMISIKGWQTKYEHNPKGQPILKIEISDVKISDVKISDVNFSDVNFSDGNFSDTKTSDTKISDAKISDTNLSDVNLSDDHLSDTQPHPVRSASPHFVCISHEQRCEEERSLVEGNLSVVNLSDAQKWGLLDKDQRRVAESRNRIRLAWLDYKYDFKVRGYSQAEADRTFEIKLSLGEICPEDVMFLKPRREFLVMWNPKHKLLSIKVIAKWDKWFKDDGDTNDYPLSLVDERKGNSGRSRGIDKLSGVDGKDMIVRDQGIDTRKYIMKLASLREYKAIEIYRLAELIYLKQGHGFDLTLRQVRKIVSDVNKDPYLIAHTRQNRAALDAVTTIVNRKNDAMPGDLWESDGHTMNNLVISPFYRHSNKSFRFLVRPVTVLWYDVATGCVVGWKMSIGENTNVVRTSLRAGISSFGVPRKVRLDRAGGYRNVFHCPREFALAKNQSATGSLAKKMIFEGDNGLYNNLGIEYSFTKPKNAKGKSIEGFWGFCVSRYEMRFPVWIGNKIENRPEVLKKPSQKVLKLYGEHIPTWEQYIELFGQYVDEWNRTPRDVLRSAGNEMMSPLEAYAEHEVESARYKSDVQLDRIMRDPYILKARIRNQQIYVNGIFYSHPAFSSLEGGDIGYYYDEHCLSAVSICYLDGRAFVEKAKAIPCGYQIDDDPVAIIDQKQREKDGRASYMLAIGYDGNKKMQKLLEQTCDEILHYQGIAQEEMKKLGGGSLPGLPHKAPKKPALDISSAVAVPNGRAKVEAYYSVDDALVKQGYDISEEAVVESAGVTDMGSVDDGVLSAEEARALYEFIKSKTG